MITRSRLHLPTSLRFSWRNMVYGAVCSTLAFGLVHFPNAPWVEVPIAVVAILGTALAIILGFKNSSAYDRWWEARKIWGGVVNESRTLTRQALHLVDPATAQPDVKAATVGMVRMQLAWVNALRLQLRRITDQAAWREGVAAHMNEDEYNALRGKTNKVTHLSMEIAAILKRLHTSGAIDGFFYVQMDNTLSRLTDLQGMAERIRSTPLPRPYDYYTKAFLNLFILFFPFGVIHTFIDAGHAWLVIPVTVVVGWIFFQLYIFGKVMSNPFENWQTDVALDAICTTIAIDLKETLGDTDIPKPLEPVDGVLM
ncbi:MAG: hypothetical protein IPM46_00680 [Flavobacteriales bacterium]|nr:hypothetical protein [Flavobacteriales bacterium]